MELLKMVYDMMPLTTIIFLMVVFICFGLIAIKWFLDPVYTGKIETPKFDRTMVEEYNPYNHLRNIPAHTNIEQLRKENMGGL